MNQEWAQNGNTQTQAERQHYTTEQRWAKEEINRELRTQADKNGNATNQNFCDAAKTEISQMKNSHFIPQRAWEKSPKLVEKRKK